MRSKFYQCPAESVAGLSTSQELSPYSNFFLFYTSKKSEAFLRCIMVDPHCSKDHFLDIKPHRIWATKGKKKQGTNNQVLVWLSHRPDIT